MRKNDMGGARSNPCRGVARPGIPIAIYAKMHAKPRRGMSAQLAETLTGTKIGAGAGQEPFSLRMGAFPDRRPQLQEPPSPPARRSSRRLRRSSASTVTFTSVFERLAVLGAVECKQLRNVADGRRRGAVERGEKAELALRQPDRAERVVEAARQRPCLPCRHRQYWL